jgi:hypothetical protein
MFVILGDDSLSIPDHFCLPFRSAFAGTRGLSVPSLSSRASTTVDVMRNHHRRRNDGSEKSER